MLPLVKNLSLEFYTNREVDQRGESLAIRKLPIDRPFIKQNYFPSLVEPEPEILAEIVSISAHCCCHNQMASFDSKFNS